MEYRIIFFAVWIAFTLIRLPHARKRKSQSSKRNERPGLEKFLVFINFVGMGILPLFFVIFPTPESLRISLPEWFVIASMVFLALSLILFYMVHKSLGANWSPVLEIYKEHSLITNGIYRYVRHPMYTQIWIWVIFQGLVLQNWLVEIIGIAAWALLYFIRIPVEERMMKETFGKEYEDYIKSTGRLLPKIF